MYICTCTDTGAHTIHTCIGTHICLSTNIKPRLEWNLQDTRKLGRSEYGGQILGKWAVCLECRTGDVAWKLFWKLSLLASHKPWWRGMERWWLCVNDSGTDKDKVLGQDWDSVAISGVTRDNRIYLLSFCPLAGQAVGCQRGTVETTRSLGKV